MRISSGARVRSVESRKMVPRCRGPQRQVFVAGRGWRTYEERAQALHCGREGCGSEAASFGQGASFGPVRRTEPEADGILPLAKGVLRERSGCLPGSRASPSPGGGEAETDRSEEH